jgi:NurA-like 5'-3' nuclease
MALSVRRLFNEIVLDAIRSRDVKLARLKDANYDEIVLEARSRWVAYTPTPRECISAGIDSSWNKRALQGLDLYAIAAVAVTSKNDILEKEWENDIASSARSEQLEAKAMEMEASLAQRVHASGKAVNMICIDGSLISRQLKSTPEAAFETARKYGNAAAVVFISKTSQSRSQFGRIGSKAGDIYYYRHATAQAGYSIPFEVQSRSGSVYEIYMRLRDDMPLLRIELAKKSCDGSEEGISKLMDLLRYHSIAGYPYCLRLAHKNCKISNEDIDRLASIYSLQNEQGARDALNE